MLLFFSCPKCISLQAQYRFEGVAVWAELHILFYFIIIISFFKSYFIIIIPMIT